jgi:hypothetical protein
LAVPYVQRLFRVADLVSSRQRINGGSICATN